MQPEFSKTDLGTDRESYPVLNFYVRSISPEPKFQSLGFNLKSVWLVFISGSVLWDLFCNVRLVVFSEMSPFESYRFQIQGTEVWIGTPKQSNDLTAVRQEIT